MNRSLPALAGALFLFQLGCGGDETPTAVATGPAPTTAPAPATAPTAAPPPAADPNICPNGNERTVSFDIKVFSVKMKNGELREFDKFGPFYVGEQLRLDSQGKDRFGRRTDGCTEPRWDWEPDQNGMLNSDKGWSPFVKVLAEGEFYVTASHDHVQDRDKGMRLTFLPAGNAPQP